MAKNKEIYSKDENLLVIVDSDFNVVETHVYIPATDSWLELSNDKIQNLAQELIQQYIEENEIKIDESVDDFGSQSYIRFVNNY